ncbi:MAG: hypothetical protein AAF772_16575, partial [Acidobacteriota bacterium]
EAIGDSTVDLFFDQLPAGEVRLSHRLRARVAGRFTVAPAVVQSLYAPANVGYSAGDAFAIASRAP